MHRVTLSSLCVWGSCHPPIPSFSGIRKVKDILLSLSMKCWNSAFNAQKFETNYSSCTVRNICSSSGGALEKGKTGWNSIYHQNWCPLMEKGKTGLNSVYHQNWCAQEKGKTGWNSVYHQNWYAQEKGKTGWNSVYHQNWCAQEKGKTGWNSVYHQNWWFSEFHPPLEC